MDGEQVTSGHARGNPGRAAYESVPLGPSREAYHDPLARLPETGNVMLPPVALHLLVDLVGKPEQGKFPQRREVADPEVVRQRSVNLVCGVDVAVRHAAPQRLGRHVDKLNLVRGAHDGVRHGFPLNDSGNLRHDVVEGLQVLDVQRGDHVDAGVEQLVDILPAFLVARSGDVGVRELVDEGDLGTAGQHGVDVHLGETGPAVVEGAPGHDLETGKGFSGLTAAMHLDQADDQVGTPVAAAVRLVEHRERLADPGRGTEVDAQPPSRHCAHRPVIRAPAPRHGPTSPA